MLGEIPVYRVGETRFWARYLFIEWETQVAGWIPVHTAGRTSFWVRYMFIEWKKQVAG